MTFGSATNIVATSLDPYGEIRLHGVDAIQMMTDLQLKKFRWIIANFPHAGFYEKENNPGLIAMHRNLVRRFLWNASSMMCPDGEIHVSQKITAPFDSWRMEDLALECSLLCNLRQDEFRHMQATPISPLMPHLIGIHISLQ